MTLILFYEGLSLNFVKYLTNIYFFKKYKNLLGNLAAIFASKMASLA